MLRVPPPIAESLCSRGDKDGGYPTWEMWRSASWAPGEAIELFDEA